MKRSPILNPQPNDDIISRNGSVTYSVNPPEKPPPNPHKSHVWHTKDRIFRWVIDYGYWIEEISEPDTPL